MRREVTPVCEQIDRGLELALHRKSLLGSRFRGNDEMGRYVRNGRILMVRSAPVPGGNALTQPVAGDLDPVARPVGDEGRVA